jgi:hypothetical protein
MSLEVPVVGIGFIAMMAALGFLGVAAVRKFKKRGYGIGTIVLTAAAGVALCFPVGLRLTAAGPAGFIAGVATATVGPPTVMLAAAALLPRRRRHGPHETRFPVYVVSVRVFHALRRRHRWAGDSFGQVGAGELSESE